ncbi:alpha-2-HS-glycoprotein-like [Narcine bancroftii]|uniref:alpha-2-HS-glycoprotein-like n=1 Tax=Narcine bancroftii TaxID=1343680 RepID=UPI0038320DF8
MKSLLAFAFCLELFTAWVVANYIAVPCTDQEALTLAEKAIDYINKDQKHGYKFVVDRLENVQKKTQGKTTYYLDIDTRESKCHVLNPKPLKNCEVRPFIETKGEGDCKVLVQVESGSPIHIIGYKCEVSPDSAEDVSKICVDCPHLIPTTSEPATHAAKVSLNTFNERSNHTHRFDLKEISRSSTKGVGHPVMVEFVIKETTCFKHTSQCTLNLLLHPDIGFCIATVTPGPSGVNGIEVNCEIYSIQVERPEPVSPRVEDHIIPIPEGDDQSTVPPTVEEEQPIVEEEATAPSIAEHQTILNGEIHDGLPTTGFPEAEKFEDFPPKRKRSVKLDSSESSEEQTLINVNKIVFPDLPEHLGSCPGVRKYPEHQ